MFIEQFWLRRDPTPDTQENQLREEHYRRIAWANDRFSYGRVAGWKSDRGMNYIKFGPPDEKEEHSEANPRTERWRYRLIEGVGNDVVIQFVDATGDGEFRMTTDPNPRTVMLERPDGTKKEFLFFSLGSVGDQFRRMQAAKQ